MNYFWRLSMKTQQYWIISIITAQRISITWCSARKTWWKTNFCIYIYALTWTLHYLICIWIHIIYHQVTGAFYLSPHRISACIHLSILKYWHNVMCWLCKINIIDPIWNIYHTIFYGINHHQANVLNPHY